MRLRRLTGLERDKDSKMSTMTSWLLIADLADILAKPERVIAVIKENWTKASVNLRRCSPHRAYGWRDISLEDEDIPHQKEEDVVIALSLKQKGAIKRNVSAQDEFRSQKRGGRGVQGTGVAVMTLFVILSQQALMISPLLRD